MVDFLSPEVIIQEEASAAVPLLASSTSTTWMEATATRGPINRSTLVTGLQDWESIYGKDDGGYGRQSVVGYFNNGGRLLYYNRVDHYDDITDRDTLDPDAAETTLSTLGAAATGASKTTAIGPFNLHPSAVAGTPLELIASIDGGGPDTLTLAITQGSLLAPGPPTLAATPGDQITFDVTTTAGLVSHVYTVIGTPTTAADYAAEITAQIPGISVDIVGGALQAVTDGYGTAYTVDISASTGTVLADSGFAVALGTAGTGVVDAEAVTAAELGPLIDAAWTGVTSVANPDGSLTTTTTATGVAASISAVSGNLEPNVGFTPAGLVTGVDAGSPSVPALKFLATSEGAHGNLLAVTLVRNDRVIGDVTEDIPAAPVTEFKISSGAQLRVGLQVFLEDTVTTGTLRGVVSAVIGDRVILKDAVTPTAAITAANVPTVTKETFTVTFLIDGDGQIPFSDLSMDDTDLKFFVGNVIGTDPTALDPRQRIYVELQGAPLSNTEDPRPVDATNTALSGGTDTSVPLVDLDYIGSESTNTGLRAADSVDGDYSILTVPGIELDSVHRAIADFAELKKSHIALINTPPGITPSAAKEWITNTTNIFTTYVAAYAGEIVVLRESSGARESFPSTGYVAGTYARNDRTDSVASAPAGVRKGQLSGVIGVGNDNIYAAKPNRDILYPDPGVNTIFSSTGRGIVTWGQLTLDSNSDRGAIGVRRAMLALERDIARISDFVLFELNTEELRQDFKTRVGGYLRGQWTAGVLQGASADEAYFIKCDEENNPPSVVNNRQFFAEIGVNVIPAIDYAVITIRRDTRALEAELAAA